MQASWVLTWTRADWTSLTRCPWHQRDGSRRVRPCVDCPRLRSETRTFARRSSSILSKLNANEQLQILLCSQRPQRSKHGCEDHRGASRGAQSVNAIQKRPVPINIMPRLMREGTRRSSIQASIRHRSRTYEALSSGQHMTRCGKHKTHCDRGFGARRRGHEREVGERSSKACRDKKVPPQLGQ